MALVQMIDSVTPAAIPKGTPVVAGYVDGPYGPSDPFHSGWTAASWGQFPGSQLVTITTLGAAGARVYDIESGDGTPSQGAAWARREIASGRRPTLYCSLSAWPGVKALAPAGVDYWIAHYDGVPNIPAGAVAKQYAQNRPGLGGHNIDVSVTNGQWPAHPIPNPPEPPMPLTKPAVEIVGTKSGQGYWIFAQDGGVFAYGDAGFFGSLGGKTLAAPIVGATVTASGLGYWMVGADGGVFAFGDAPFKGAPT